MMINAFRRFCAEEDGAVTVDWIVLTAAVVGLGIAVATIVAQSATPVAENLGQYLKDRPTGL